ncbi:uncharacterized protein LOC125252375 isoform X2 [Megalobrama amblycephala]|uniref:uncharacterized protein LOC125252375 isoform X2 n=1 Tax=Megalobrama amblycephala TaxID=75352 RepID=UPI002014643C|nr:uncharacterized protein LOC125252375 isoform X2 [Megalobrama amblycephala]
MVLDSEEEFTFSSEEEHDSDDERLHFEERLDPAEDTVSDENVDPSLSHSPEILTKRARSNTGDNEKENVDPSLSHSPAIPTKRAPSNTGDNEKENVDPSLSHSPAIPTKRAPSNTGDNEKDYSPNESAPKPLAKKAKKNIQTSNRHSALSWKTDNDTDMVPQTLRFLPAREPGPQLRPADEHTPKSLFKMFKMQGIMPPLVVGTACFAKYSLVKGKTHLGNARHVTFTCVFS